MAPRKTPTKPQKPNYTCKDCAHSTDWHNRGADGTMILCSCKFHKWCRFLNRDYCDHFTHRTR